MHSAGKLLDKVSIEVLSSCFIFSKSLEDKMSLVGKYGLGGTAFWRYGFEAENTFSELLNVKENQEKNGKIDIDNFSLHDYLAEKKQKLQEMQE